MLTARASGSTSSNYERYYAVAEFNNETLRQSKKIFSDYRSSGVILSENFECREWIVTNQLGKITLRFCADELAFRKNAKEWLGCSYHCFTDGVKAYALFHMGIIELSGIREIVRKLTQISTKTCAELPIEPHIIEFLKLLPGSEIKDQVVEDMEERLIFSRQKHKKSGQRILSDFENYFKFNDALEVFWQQAGDVERLFYFPMYFWWTLTAILPLRPTEFLLTPRQCLERKNNENILTVRRTALKGGRRKVHYNIKGDYTLTKYSIPEKMATVIEWYLTTTSDMPASPLDTLFVQRPHYAYFDRSTPIHSVYYTYPNLSYCLRRFQEEIMQVKSADSRVNLGDTRHLAMISLIASGGSPVICKELAGHEDVNISAHYYSNISKFVECATYEMYKKHKGVSVDMFEHKTTLCVSETVPVTGGRCDSAAYIAGNISDCIRAVGSDSELGHCISCPHFIDGKSGRYLLFSDSGERKKQVDEDSKYLMRVLDMVRRGKGCDEDIQSALLKLQHSSSVYSRCLFSHMEGI